MKSLPASWSKEQLALFDRLYGFILNHQAAMIHPEAAPAPLLHWNTVAHNAAYAAACLVDGSLTIIDLDTKETLAESHVLQ